MTNIQLSGRSYEITDELRRYVDKKLGRLDRYLPHAHKATGMSVEIFRDPSGKEDNRYKVTARLNLPGSEIVAETATMNPHSAIDIVEQKLVIQIQKYKQKHGVKRFRVKEMLGGQTDDQV